MFQDLDLTLLQLLNDVAAPAELQAAAKSFETPDKNFGQNLLMNTLNLFLFNVAENRELRDPRPIEERLGTIVTRRPAPIRMNGTYMVTAWSMSVGANKIAEEHQLLAQAIAWLARFSTIPAQYHQGGIAGQRYPPLLGVAQLDPTKDAGEFWVALGIVPRPVIALTSTVTMEIGELTETPAATTITTQYERLDA
jgi:hypothetical protein